MQEDKTNSEFISQDFKKAKGISHIKKRKKLFSRKNNVFEVEITFKDGKKQLYVLKEYAGVKDQDKLKKETYWYDILKETAIKTPSIYYKGRNFIILEHLGKITLLDYIISAEKDMKNLNTALEKSYILKKDYPFLAGALKWIYDFNRQTVISTGKSFILNDLNFRNFILKDNEVFRIDFEDCSRGMAEEDFSRFIAFFLTYEPSFTEWKKSVSGLIKKMCSDEMGLSIDNVEKGIELEFKDMHKRRKHMRQTVIK
ncbi:MAG: hypothetical protein JW997_06735 [Actinobacteria bacterium]|nr:hypothetical protein [Actinomycetota bacterium]